MSAQLGDLADVACWLAVLVIGGRQIVANGMSPGHLLGSVTSLEVREDLVYVASCSAGRRHPELLVWTSPAHRSSESSGGSRALWFSHSS